MASVVLQGRNIRRARTARISDQDVFKLDNQKDVAVNLREILVQLTRKDVSRMRKLSCYNATCRLMYRIGPNTDLGLTNLSVLACLRPGLFSSYKEIRTACLRAIRYCCQSFETVASILTLHMDYMIVRSLDIRLDNEVERVHALRLIRKIMLIDPLHFPLSLLRPVISIANDGMKERDKLVRTCLATICELTLYNGGLVAKASGISTIIHSILNCHSLSRINESLTATIIYLLNRPSTRCYIWSGVDLEQMLAPYTDYQYKGIPDSPTENNGEDVEQRYEACKMALVCILKSWPGIYWLCQPRSSALRSLIGMLHLPSMENRKEIMNVIFDVFRLPVPDWTESFDQALISIDLSEMNDSWKLLEGFVVEEGKCILPHCSKTRPNLVVAHTALLLSVFVQSDLLDALVQVIVTSNRFVAVRATVLLGELLYMSSQLLPLGISRYHQCLPSLISQATMFDTSSHQYLEANAAIRCLQRVYTMRRKGCVPASLFLDQLLYGVNLHCVRKEKPTSSGGQTCEHCGSDSGTEVEQTKDSQDKEREAVSQAIRDSQVLYTKDNNSWDWVLVSVILTWPDVLRRMQDQLSQRFIRRLLFVLTPTKRIYSTVELSSDAHRKMTLTGLNLIDFLTCGSQPFSDEIEKSIKEFLDDIATCLNDVKSESRSNKESPIFSTSNLAYTCCQNYFLFIGRFSTTEQGNTLLEDNKIYQSLMSLVCSTTHDSYIKLIVSSLDYNREGSARLLLSKALKATSESARQYVTGFMRVLMRARVDGFCEWGVEALVAQLYDSSSAVAMEALSVLSEATAIQSHLISLIRLKPSVLHLGHKGELLLAKFLSIEFGFRTLARTAFISNELEKWRSSFNIKYVGIVEERLNEALTTYEKTYDGSYVRRSHHRTPRKDVYLPVHLYSQLVRHSEGCALLAEQPYLETEIFHYLRPSAEFDSDCEMDIMKVKASLWAAGHIGRSEAGVDILEKYSVIKDLVSLAEKSSVYSIRGTAYYALGLVGGTTRGADMLEHHGWESVRHARPEAHKLWFSPNIKTFELNQTDNIESTVSDDAGDRLSLDFTGEKKSKKIFKERASSASSQEAASRPSFYMLGSDGTGDSLSSSGEAVRPGRHVDDSKIGSVQSEGSARDMWLLRNASPGSGDIGSGDGIMEGSSGGRSAKYLSESSSGGRCLSSGLGSVREERTVNFDDDIKEEGRHSKPLERNNDSVKLAGTKTTDMPRLLPSSLTIKSPTTGIVASSSAATASTTSGSAPTSVSSTNMFASMRSSVSPRLSSLEEDAVLEIPTFSRSTRPPDCDKLSPGDQISLGSPRQRSIEMDGSFSSSAEIVAETPLAGQGSDAESNFVTPTSVSPVDSTSLTRSSENNKLYSAHNVSEAPLRVKASISSRPSCRVSIDGSELVQCSSASASGSTLTEQNFPKSTHSPDVMSALGTATLPPRGITSPCLTAMASENITQEQGTRETVELRNKEGFNVWREIRSSTRYNSVDHVSSNTESNRVTFAGFPLEKRQAAMSKSRSLDYRTSKTRSSIRNLVPRRHSKRRSTCSHCGSVETRDRKISMERSLAALSSKVAAPNLDLAVGGPEFIGISIPVDIDSIFYESENDRSNSKDTSYKQHYNSNTAPLLTVNSSLSNTGASTAVLDAIVECGATSVTSDSTAVSVAGTGSTTSTTHENSINYSASNFSGLAAATTAAAGNMYPVAKLTAAGPVSAYAASFDTMGVSNSTVDVLCTGAIATVAAAATTNIAAVVSTDSITTTTTVVLSTSASAAANKTTASAASAASSATATTASSATATAASYATATTASNATASAAATLSSTCAEAARIVSLKVAEVAAATACVATDRSSGSPDRHDSEHRVDHTEVTGTDGGVIEKDSDVEVHTVEGCLACHRIKLETLSPSGESSSVRKSKQDFEGGLENDIVVNEISTERVAKSCTTTEAATVSTEEHDDPSEEELNVKTESGRNRIKKEIVRLVINLSSSIGVKNIEQALLVLKQKYSVMFQDLCLYSQISALLATYNYRIACRRFIQELFQELDVTPCLHDPCAILSVNEDTMLEEGVEGRQELEEEGDKVID